MLALGPVLLLGAATPVRAEDPALPSVRAIHGSCDYCALAEDPELRDLSEAAVDSIGFRLGEQNLVLWVRTDSLFRAGAFGPPGDGASRRRARAHFLLRSRNAFDYLVDVALTNRVYRVEEATIGPPFGEHYTNTAIYPLRFLRQGLAGRGGFCMQYEIAESFDERILTGGLPLRLRRDRVEVERSGVYLPAISLELISQMHKAVTLLFRTNVCGIVRRELLIDRGDTLELTTVREIDGMYVRKAGVHRLSAIAVWRSTVNGDRMPENPRSGACAYFPGIELKLPFLLPDLGLDDLRDFDLPNPVVPVDWVRGEPSLEWLRVDREGVFDPWESIGPRPEVLDSRFPDL